MTTFARPDQEKSEVYQRRKDFRKAPAEVVRTLQEDFVEHLFFLFFTQTTLY